MSGRKNGIAKNAEADAGDQGYPKHKCESTPLFGNDLAVRCEGEEGGRRGKGDQK